jgi:predicted nucleotidyltransferase
MKAAMNTHSQELPIAALRDLCLKYQVRELALFGSAARGEQNEDSDLDFLVEFEPQARIGFLSFSSLSRELSALTHCRVDLVPKLGLKKTIRDQVLAEAKIIYAS